MVEFTRTTELAEENIIICGFSGSGKSLMGPILGSFERVEPFRIDPIYEYFCILECFGKVEKDATTALLRTLNDRHIYYQVISRETNMRVRDDSSPLNNPHTFRTIKRLFAKDGDFAVEEIKKNKPIQLLMMHHLIPVISPIFRAWGDRVKVVKIVRHPMYMIDPWFKYMDRNGRTRYGIDPYELTLYLDYNGHSVPWFTHGWEDKFISVSTMDKIIYSINWLNEKSKETYNNLDESDRNKIIFIPFEPFVLDPFPYLEKLEEFLNTPMTRLTKKTLRKQKVPRKAISDGRMPKRYEKDFEASEIDEFNNRKTFAKEKASPEAFKLLKKMCDEYMHEYNISCVPDF
jgi:hypothetical protein